MRVRGSVALQNQVVAITGGARGIGKATARAFLEAGARVAIGDLDAALAVETAQELGGLDRVTGHALDVTDPASFEAFLGATELRLGNLDVLVNNAGIMPTGLFLDEKLTTTDRMIEINLRGVITGSRLAGERFLPRGRGHLVNIASLAGVASYPGLATYCATKHAVVGFSEALQREWEESGVQVTTVLPGVVRTELSSGAEVPRWAQGLTTVDPEDVADSIVRAIRYPKTLVTVPQRLGQVVTMLGILPASTRNRLERITHLDTAFSHAHGPEREAYHRRIETIS